ncbi:hypothetical protein ACQ4M3_29090 [Leptolyngbya sp. AN03gr2]|uniref:hypothetical protein n=1 Tax=unclassified Leptolyngbya TaxID=2650499 RepID=UPI003D322F8B
MRRPHQTPSLLGFALICGLIGVLVGGTAAFAEEQQCLRTASPDNHCLTVPTALRVAKSSTSGLFAGTFAALLIGWRKFR